MDGWVDDESDRDRGALGMETLGTMESMEMLGQVCVGLWIPQFAKALLLRSTHTHILSLGATDLFSLTQTQTRSSRGVRNWQAFATPPGPRETLPQDYGQCKVCPPPAACPSCPSCQSCVICTWPPSYTSYVHATCGRGRDGAWNWMATTDQQPPREPAQCFMCLVGVPDWAASRLPLLCLSACCLLALWPPSSASLQPSPPSCACVWTQLWY